MQPVANLELFQLAEIAVELAERRRLAVAGPDAAIGRQSLALGKVPDIRSQHGQAARVERRCLIVFVHQPFQLHHRSVALGARERRGQMVHDCGMSAALRLRAFARIVDDEGVEVRRGPEHGVREAVPGERQRLARQPFQIAVLAEMDDRVGRKAPPQPAIEGEIGGRRRQGGIVVAGSRVDVVTARRLHRDGDIAEQERGNYGVPAVEAPAFAHSFRGGFGQVAQEGLERAFRKDGPAGPCSL